MATNFYEYYRQYTDKELREPRNDEEVKAILALLRRRNGFRDADDEEKLSQMPPELRKGYILDQNYLQVVLGKFTTSISGGMYATGFHFLFEILQNADDADYHQLESSKQKPTVTFRIRPHEFVIDLNEDGFNVDNVIAICSTGDSSKKLNAFTTGEKGFGFKSVFSIASKVHVQSHKWSFAFTYSEGDTGTGMISPSWEKPNSLPVGVNTRFVLTYKFKVEEQEEKLARLCEQIDEQPVTITSFLRQVRKLEFHFENVLGRNDQVTFEHLGKSFQAGKTFVRLAKTKDGSRDVHTFLERKSMVKDLPSRIGRTEGTSELVIYFPVKDTRLMMPILDPDGQHVSTYLPVMRLPGLPFMIQADFELPGSRENVQDDSPWNNKLRLGIVHLFVASVGFFASESGTDIQLSWLSYVPRGPFTGFWREFPMMIENELKKAKVFLDAQGVLSTASVLRHVPARFMHQGKALLPCRLSQLSYLAPGYAPSNYALLRRLGVSELRSEDMLRIVVTEASSDDSKLRSVGLNDPWQEDYAKLLVSLIAGSGTETVRNAKSELSRSRIFPIRRGKSLEWSAINSLDVFLPDALNTTYAEDKIKIPMPNDLGILVIHPEAYRGEARQEFYKLMDIKQCPIKNIVKKAQELHRTGNFNKHNSSLLDILHHLEILFWDGTKNKTPLFAFGPQPYHLCSTTDMFFQSENELHTEKIVAIGELEDEKRYLLHPMFSTSQMVPHTRHGKTWFKFLESVAGIRWFPPLYNFSEKKLHWTILKVLERCPKKFLELLQAHWELEYLQVCQKDPEIEAAIRSVAVPCLGGSKTAIQDSFFPHPEIVQNAAFYGVTEQIGILDLPDSAGGIKPSNQWSSLLYLGVQREPNLGFYKLILTTLAKSNISISDIGVSSLYQKIAEMAQYVEHESLQNLFDEDALTWDSIRSKWWLRKDCVWSSEVPLTQKFVVSLLYANKAHKNLFENILGLGSSTIDDLLNELRYMRTFPTISSDHAADLIARMYSVLDGMAAKAEPKAKDKIRLAFNAESLVFFEGQWLKPSECVWHESVSVGHHVPIKAAFNEMQGFFVDLLGVRMMNTHFMVNELVRASERGTKDPKALLDLMIQTSVFLERETEIEKFSQTFEKLRQCRFLHCRMGSGEMRFLESADEFFVPDDFEVARAFKDKFNFLKVTYAELNMIQKLLVCLGLDGKYLSRQDIRTETTVEGATFDISLTSWLRDCAFAISSVAVFHHSPLYSNHAQAEHDLLRNVTVRTSSNISTNLFVGKGEEAPNVPISRTSLDISMEAGGLFITLPESLEDRKQCLRSELPKKLMTEIGLLDDSARTKIHRILNEQDTGTDEILLQEGVPPAEWLHKTQRVVTLTPPPSPDKSAAVLTQDVSKFAAAISVTPANDQVVSKTESIRPDLIPIPAKVNHTVQAPKYGSVLDHVSKQAPTIRFRNTTSEKSLKTKYESLAVVKNSGRGDLFGSDDIWKYRIGAAGELLTFLMLQSIVGKGISIDNWKSGIRHFVRPLKGFEAVPHYNFPETSDLIYEDKDCTLLNAFKAGPIGDLLEDWLPEWLQDRDEPLEWHFEVKTALGPCEAECYMSSRQYRQMREAGEDLEVESKQVYCIVRVYDLLQDEVGVKILIDPWRYREDIMELDTTDMWKVMIK